jgi:NAD(P)-dependent dehydrogenase (short-subunit alcohol dehydrogenase family)
MARKKIDIAIPDLQGKLAVVTGASDGLGLEIARRLAIAGSEVILPVRNPKKGQAAMLRIAESNPFTKVSTRPLDLASLQSVADLDQQCRCDDTSGPLSVHRRLRAPVRDEFSGSLRAGGSRVAAAES